jgi:hypothetical protein
MSEVLDPKYDVSAEGRKLVKDYQHSLARVEQATNERNRAVTDEANARRALIKWCSPGDAKPGEKFGIWSRDQYGKEVLIEVQTEYTDPSTSTGDAYISQRHEGRVKLRYRK